MKQVGGNCNPEDGMEATTMEGRAFCPLESRKMSEL